MELLKGAVHKRGGGEIRGNEGSGLRSFSIDPKELPADTQVVRKVETEAVVQFQLSAIALVGGRRIVQFINEELKDGESVVDEEQKRSSGW